MMRNRVTGIVLVLLLGCLFVSLSESRIGKAESSTIAVPRDYPTIQDAVDHAVPGETVAVSSGTYYGNVYIDKNLTLIGKGMENTVLNAWGNWFGILANLTSVSISGFTVLNATVGIVLGNCSGSNVSGNDVTGSHGNVSSQEEGIWLYSSNSSMLCGNVVHDCALYGIVLCGHSSDDTVILNTVEGCGTGLAVSGENSLILHNSFVNNQNQIKILDSFPNDWNDTHEGNYWSDYGGRDVFSGPNQNETGSDGIGDTPYVIDANNTDHYPLMNPYASPPPLQVSISPASSSILSDHSVSFNSTISGGSYPFSYQWYLNNTAVPRATLNQWTFQQPAGNYNVHLNVTDILGSSAESNEAAVTVTVAPTLTANFTYTVPPHQMGNTVAFNASSSMPNNGTIVSYSWNFGDGNTTSTDSPVTEHAYAEQGSYSVQLTILDSEGSNSSYQANIEVNTDTMPEFPSVAALPLLVLFTLPLAIFLKRGRRTRTPASAVNPNNDERALAAGFL